MKGKVPIPAINRFEALYIEEPNTGCWLWTGYTDPAGYGRFYNGKNVKASRFSYEAHNGKIENGLHVLHRCDTPACVNPGHLFLGTNRENIIDCWSKGRRTRVDPNSRGENHGCAKLTASDVEKIKSDTRTHKEIAAEYKMSRAHISKIKNGSSWA